MCIDSYSYQAAAIKLSFYDTPVLKHSQAVSGQRATIITPM